MAKVWLNFLPGNNLLWKQNRLVSNFSLITLTNAFKISLEIGGTYSGFINITISMNITSINTKLLRFQMENGVLFSSLLWQ